MAVRDHSLDGRIVEAAKAEFMALGYQRASLHKIADRAGITTGALYTRYKNKDALFCSLVSSAFANLGPKLDPIRQHYKDARFAGSVDELLAAIRQEEQMYLDLLFDHYDECILFFCRSDGSSIQTTIEKMMDQKARDTMDFLRSIARKDVNLDGLEMILYEQFRYYRLILEKGYSRERAVACMETVEDFLDAGWKDLFERLL